METDIFQYIVGIDLGTTNSAVAFVELKAEAAKNRGIRLFKVPQLSGPGEVSALPVLPSFCYIPGPYDISRDLTTLPWTADAPHFVGQFARDHGAKIPSRLVSSAKSWLCHPNADRRAGILPWGAPPEVAKLSPVQATAAYLNHIRLAWNSGKNDDDEHHLEHQLIILAVPASFDEVARDLTLEAAALAGLPNVTLLEEPLAAFYSWLIRHENHWDRNIRPGELVLVCDVGGGTSDFTLISLRETEGTPRFERIAVGDHLILGGDNIDLALARLMERKFNSPKALSGDRWKTLCHLCRRAKETLFDNVKTAETITMMGEGTSLIGGALTAKLERGELEKIVIDGFFPLVDGGSALSRNPRKAISEFGLPYESDPAITRHIGLFLEKHTADVKRFLDKPPFPDAVLFNGGSLKSSLIQGRIQEAIRHWFGAREDPRPRILENPAPDLAVALGAAYYGLVKTGRGVRVGSGSARSYYLGFGRKSEEATPVPADGGIPAIPGDRPVPVPKSAICLVERGLDEGMRISLPEKKFLVLANRPVSFDLYSSTFRSGDRCGDVVAVDDTLTPLPPLQTVIQFGRKGEKQEIPVLVEAEYNEVGALSLWCRSLSSNHRWRLRFQLRAMDGAAGVADGEIFDAGLMEQAVAAVHRAFSPEGEAARMSGLVKEISGYINRIRDKWPLGFIRRLADALLETMDARKYSAEHEARWLNLTGWCLRPGFGDALDPQRMKQLWKSYKSGPFFPKNPQCAAEWWILWRRVAGGLTSGQQRQFIQDVRAVLIPKKGVKIRVSPQERLEIWMAVANMERLTVKDKVEYGRALMAELHPTRTRPQLFWALSRIGARELLYGPVDRVTPPAEASQWIVRLMAVDWNPAGPAGAAIAQIARKTGDMARDLPAETMAVALAWLENHQLTEEARRLTSIRPMALQEESLVFGESLPSGIVLHEAATGEGG